MEVGSGRGPGRPRSFRGAGTDLGIGKLPWYKPNPAFDPTKLSPVVKANVQKLKELKAKRRGCQ